MTVRAIRWWRASERERVAAEILRVTLSWARDWDIQLDIRADCDSIGPDYVAPTSIERWRPLGDMAGAGGGAAWVPADLAHWPAFMALWRRADVLARSDDDRAPISREVAGLAWKAWQEALRVRLSLEQPSHADRVPAASIWQDGGGAVAVRLSVGPSAVVLLLEAPVVATLLGYPQSCVTAGARTGLAGGLAPLATVMSGRSVQLRLELHPVDIDLGMLCSLAIGDVLALPHHVDAPATVVDEEGEAAFDAFLVSREQRKAVQICAPARE